MIIVHCPYCREQVTAPSGVSRQARVRCPLCSEEYLLEDALRLLPPLLSVVHDPEAANAASGETLMAAAPGFVGAESIRRPIDSADEFADFPLESPASRVPAFQFEPGSARRGGRGYPEDGPASTHRPRVRRKRGGPARLVIQTIGGGILGLVIAQLILWWMPGNWDVNNRDPFQLAARVATYTPFLVPASLRASSLPLPVDIPKPESVREPPPPEAPSVPTGTMVESSPGETATPAVDPPRSDFDFQATAPSAQPPVDSTSEEAEDAVGLREPPEFRAEDIASRFADLVSADVAWDSAVEPTVPQKRLLITAIYDHLAGLGGAVAVVGRKHPEASESLAAVAQKLQSLVDQTSKMIPIGQLGGLRLPSHPDSGSVWYGTVVSHQPRGRMFETEIRLSARMSPDPIVKLISPSDLTDPLPKDVKALIIGRLVSDPAKNLVGYEGDDQSVMLYGMHAVARSEPSQP